MNAHLLDSMRGLHSRVNDGIHVRLLWREHDDRIVVAVDDARTGDAFSIDVRGDERALDVFHHPYAYAGWHGIPTPRLGRGWRWPDRRDETRHAASPVGVLALGALVLTASAGYVLLAQPRVERWGVTDAEHHTTWPRDELEHAVAVRDDPHDLIARRQLPAARPTRLLGIVEPRSVMRRRARWKRLARLPHRVAAAPARRLRRS